MRNRVFWPGTRPGGCGIPENWPPGSSIAWRTKAWLWVNWTHSAGLGLSPILRWRLRGCRSHEDPGRKAAFAQMLAAESMINQTEIYAGINK